METGNQASVLKNQKLKLEAEDTAHHLGDIRSRHLNPESTVMYRYKKYFSSPVFFPLLLTCTLLSAMAQTLCHHAICCTQSVIVHH